jgi:DNA primase
MLLMRNEVTYTKSRFKKGKITCPVCGRTHRYHCSVTVDGGLALCRNRGSDKQAEDGRFIHVLTTGWKQGFALSLPAAEQAKEERADPDRLHAVYSKLLSKLYLAPAHGDELLVNRGLSDTTIAYNLYASVPEDGEGDSLALKLSNEFDLKGVPGFYRVDGRWKFVTSGSGFYVPHRDERGRILGLQIRHDESQKPKYKWLSSNGRPDGTAATACIHFVKPDLAESSAKVIITEGALKADRISEFAGAPAVAIAGVSAVSPDSLITRLREALPRIKEVCLAFDMDWQDKSEVREALLKLLRRLKTTTWKVTGLEWEISAGKGYDDYLFNRLGI